jgi:hypothetical protein
LQTALFVQLHAIANSTCTVDAFVSHGGGGTAVYGEAGNIATALATTLPGQVLAAGQGTVTAATPATNTCVNKGSDNIFGRRVNGVAWQVCVCAARSAAVEILVLAVSQKPHIQLLLSV